MATYRDKRTGAQISQDTYNRSIKQGGSPKNFEKISEKDLPKTERVFKNLEDFDYDESDYSDYEELIFDGGADYGNE
jgi:hypothetical protein